MERTATSKKATLHSVSSQPIVTSLNFARTPTDSIHEAHQSLPQLDTLISTLWVQLTDIYGARFVNAYGVKDTGVWYHALCDLTEDDFRQGLYLMMRDARFETWPPNCTQFRQLCLKGKTGLLPTVHQAFSEARQNALYASPKWSHPAVKFTVKYVGVDVVNSAYTHVAFQTFEKGYLKVCARIADGFAVPDVNDEEVSYYHREKTKNAISHIKNNNITFRSVIHGHC